VLKLGLIVNPFAGIGGSVALKGREGSAVREQALSLGAELRAARRCGRALAGLAEQGQHVYCWGGSMGADICASLGVAHTIVGKAGAEVSEAADTVAAARALADCQIDLLVFVGGDGTARDVLDALGEHSRLPVL